MSILGEMIRNANKLLSIIEMKIHRKRCYSHPSQVHILAQYECNYNCEFCGFDYRTNPLKKQLTLCEYKIILKHLWAKMVKGIVFSGLGEPLLCNDLDKIVKYTREKFPHIKLMVNTNGELLTGEKAEMVANNFDTVVVSLHSLEPETYATMCGKDSLNIVLDNIAEVRRINPDIKFTLYFTYSMRNIDEMKSHIEFCAKLGNCFYIGSYAKFYTKRSCFSDMKNNKLFNSMDKDLSLFKHQEHSDKIISEAKEYAVEIGLKKYVFPPLFSSLNKRINCSFPYSQIMINPDGQVYPCGGSEVFMHDDVSKGILNFGNLIDSKIGKIWNNKSYMRLRKSSYGKCKCRDVKQCENCSNMGFLLTSGNVEESHFCKSI